MHVRVLRICAFHNILTRYVFECGAGEMDSLWKLFKEMFGSKKDEITIAVYLHNEEMKVTLCWNSEI